jgi:hypothetical protein
MFKNIKALFLIELVLFLAIALLISVVAIWGAIDNATAKDLLTKTAYTFGAVFIVSALVAAIKK